MQWLWLVIGLVIGFLVAWWWSRNQFGPRLDAIETQALNEGHRADAAEEASATYKLEAENLAEQLTGVTAERDNLSRDLVSSTESLSNANKALMEAQREGDAAIAGREHAESDRQRLIDEAAEAKAAAAASETKYLSVTDEFVEVRRQARLAESERDQVLQDRDGKMEYERRTAEAEASGSKAEAGVGELQKRLSVAEARVAALGESSEEAAKAHEELGLVRSALSRSEERVSELERAARNQGDVVETVRDVSQTASAASAEGLLEADHVDEASPEAADEPEPVTVPGLAVADRAADRTDADEGSDEPQASDEPGQEADDLREPKTPGDEATTTDPDDLRAVKGIGPKFERFLHARDVVTYRQIIDLKDDAEWEDYLETFTGRIEREDWRGQARSLHNQKYGSSQ